MIRGISIRSNSFILTKSRIIKRIALLTQQNDERIRLEIKDQEGLREMNSLSMNVKGLAKNTEILFHPSSKTYRHFTDPATTDAASSSAAAAAADSTTLLEEAIIVEKLEKFAADAEMKERMDKMRLELEKQSEALDKVLENLNQEQVPPPYVEGSTGDLIDSCSRVKALRENELTLRAQMTVMKNRTEALEAVIRRSEANDRLRKGF